jgi:hypothetical protein
MVLSATDNQTLQLLEYSPHTVNTAVAQSQSTANSSSSATNETSTSSTTGTSQQQSSTYGVSVTLGDTFSGVTGSYEHSQATENSKSKSVGVGKSASVTGGSDTSLGSSMSIKDWGTYASIDGSTVCPSWVFGQEYPWNAIEAKFYAEDSYNGNGTQYKMYISSAMEANLYDRVFLYPPSELAMFGVNFLMKSLWRVIIDDTASTNLVFNHTISPYLATHVIEDNQVVVYMNNKANPLTTTAAGSADQTATITLDANMMALDPLGVNSDAAIVGFIPNKFIPPVSGTVPNYFKTIATTNDLIIEDTTCYPSDKGSGFTLSQTCLTATWSNSQNFVYQITLYFKVIDSVSDYTLYTKHWITQSTGVTLSIVVNGDTSNTITKSVDALEAEGGENNLLTIALRNLDFASVSYHDYLQLGLNSVQITMQPVTALEPTPVWSNCAYQIRAVSIVKS